MKHLLTKILKDGTVSRVLVVDDSSFMRKRIISVLEKAGHLVAGQAADGSEGYELYKKCHPDYVIMDITMRGTDGITGARLIKAWDPGARIIFMSLMTDPEIVRQVKELNALGFIRKNEHNGLLNLIQG